MKRIAGIIINSPDQNNLGALIYHRSIHTVPFGGKYRLIDFPLSSFVNSNIRKVAVIGSYKYRSLMDHLGSGEDWNLSRKSNELSILHGGKNKKIGEIARISLQDLIDNEEFFRKISSSIKDIVLSNCNTIARIDVEKVFEEHQKTNADVTMVYKADYTSDDLYKGAVLDIEEDVVRGITDNSIRRLDSFNLYAGILIIKRELLESIIQESKETGDYDLIEVLKTNIESLNIRAYKTDRYVKVVNSIKSYFDVSMYLLKPEVQEDLFYSDKKIFTKPKDNHPTKYNKSSNVKNSIIASGSHINGNVENSIIFREVCIEEGVTIKNSIIMQNCHIEKNTKIVNGILDKYVRVTEGKILQGTEDKPLLIKKDSVI